MTEPGRLAGILAKQSTINLETAATGETYTYRLDEFGKGYLAGALLVTDCPCDCGCGELSEDGEECICCRTGVHNADQE